MLYTLSNKKLTVVINEQGAELSSVIKNGKEFIWQNQDGKWDGHAPILFPVCGHFTLIHNGVKYPLGSHGFARKKKFTLIEKTKDSVSLLIKSDSETKKVYPFDFEFTVRYEIKGDKLFIIYEVKNPDKEDLYFSCGGHESFNLDCDSGEYYVKFDKREDMVNYPDTDGYLTDKVVYMKPGKTIDFKKNSLIDDVTIILNEINSKSLTLRKKTGEKIAKVNFGGLNNVLFWRPETSNVVCIEPWCNIPDRIGEEYGEFKSRDGVKKVLSGETVKITRWIKYY